MKTFLLSLCVFVVGLTTANAQRPFVAIWKSFYKGSSQSNQIEIPAQGNFTYTWESVGALNEKGSGSGYGKTIIEFPYEGMYRVSLTPSGSNPLHKLEFNDSGDALKIAEIEQWGDMVWSDFSHAFHGCFYLKIPAHDAPNLSRVRDMSYGLSGLGSETIEYINYWNVSNVENMAYLFSETTFLDVDLSKWNVSKVTNMSNMFYGANKFNSNIGGWNVSNVTNMELMFAFAFKFNQPIGKWNVSKVTTMEKMFFEASDFSYDLSRWDVRNVRNMFAMFMNADQFNRNISSWKIHNGIKQSDLFLD